MTLAIYPDQTLLPGLGFSVKWKPQFYNMATATKADGSDTDISMAPYPLHDFELLYEFLHDRSTRSLKESLEFKTLLGFYLQQGGTVGRFLFKNPDDCQVFQQSVGTGDGSTTVFTLVRTFGANGFGITEPVGMVSTTDPFNVYLNNSDIPLVLGTDYSLQTTNPVANTITFLISPPPLGQNVSVDMTFYYYMKFPTNTTTFEKFMDRLWSNGSVVLHACRAGT